MLDRLCFFPMDIAAWMDRKTWRWARKEWRHIYWVYIYWDECYRPGPNRGGGVRRKLHTVGCWNRDGWRPGRYV